MNSLASVFSALNRLQESGLVESYAIGGATAVLFYAEPTRTYDLDMFVIVPAPAGSALTPLAAVYEWARRSDYRIDAEHVMIDGVPVKFLPTYTPLVEESVRRARVFEYDGVPVRVVGPEHLVGLALQAGGARRRERAYLLLESGAVDAAILRDVLTRHGLPTVILDGS
jgi:hypothetical protein